MTSKAPRDGRTSAHRDAHVRTTTHLGRALSPVRGVRRRVRHEREAAPVRRLARDHVPIVVVCESARHKLIISHASPPRPP